MQWIKTNCFLLLECKDLKLHQKTFFFAICLKQWVGLTLDIWPSNTLDLQFKWKYICSSKKQQCPEDTAIVFFFVINIFAVHRTSNISCGGGIFFFKHTHKQNVPTKIWVPSEVKPISRLYVQRLFSPYALCLHVHQRLKCTLSFHVNKTAPPFENKVHRFINS